MSRIFSEGQNDLRLMGIESLLFLSLAIGACGCASHRASACGANGLEPVEAATHIGGESIFTPARERKAIDEVKSYLYEHWNRIYGCDGVSGTVTFNVDSTGRISEWEMPRSSGSSGFDVSVRWLMDGVKTIPINQMCYAKGYTSFTLRLEYSECKTFWSRLRKDVNGYCEEEPILHREN